MANYFEDDVRIVIAPRMAVGPQGANAPEVQVQYSSDGSNWHDTPQSGDMYLRFSTDDGDTWGEAVRLAEVAIDDQITDGVTDRAPSQNAVYDALATKIGNVVEDTTPELGGNLDGQGNDLNNIGKVDFTSEYDNGTVTSDTTIDWSNGQNQKITLGANVTLSFTNIGVGHKQLKILQDSTGGWVPTLPTGKWPGGTIGSFSTAANAEDILSIYYDGASLYYQVTKGWA